MANVNDWTFEAVAAIRMCEKWAARVVSATPCQLFLFGSAIYKGGEQFNREQSDLDIVCLLPEPNSALSRLDTLEALFGLKSDLELEMIRALSRSTCTEPGVSLVTVTDMEVRANIHKSGARSFFSKNFFYDLTAKQETLLPSAGTRKMKDENRQALEYVQKLRNEYLSVCANGDGGLCDFTGVDPMPKALLRAAAQLNADALEGEWYDTRLGLELMATLLQKRRTDDGRFKNLFDCVSVRRGGRGSKKALSSANQMLLAEMLFDVAAAPENTEDVATWEIRLQTRSSSAAEANALFASVLRLVPDALLIGVAAGGIILTVRSSVGGYKVLADLQELGVLAKMLRVDSAKLARVDGDPSQRQGLRENSRQQHLVECISQWRPQGIISWSAEEDEFANFLQGLIMSDPALADALVERNIHETASGVSYEMDFVLSWSAPGISDERVNIELSRLRSVSTFFRKMSLLLPLNRPIIFVAVGDAKILSKLAPDVNRLALLNANVKVVPVELPRPETVGVGYADFAEFLRAQPNKHWTLSGGNTFGVAPQCTVDEIITYLLENNTGSQLVYVFSELGDEGPYGAAMRTDWRKVPRIDADALSQYVVRTVDGADFMYIAPSVEAGSNGIYMTLLPA